MDRKYSEETHQTGAKSQTTILLGEIGDAQLKVLLNKVEYVAPNRAAPALNSTEPAANISGYAYRLERQAVKDCAQREFFFSNRMVPVRNSLPEHVVNAKNTNEFKNLLDKFDKEKG